MKKKLLSVLMAGALVATSSVNALAADKVINGSDTAEYQHNIGITGDVQNDAGEVKPGNLNVTVPTAAAFTVDKDGNFSSGTITIRNSGSQSVDVYAHAFTDVGANTGITVLGEDEIDENVDRTHISLSIKGNNGTAYLGSEAGSYKNGIYSDPNLDTEVPVNSPIRLSVITSGSQDDLKLSGNVGTNTDENITEAVQDNFTLVLKIKKTDNK